MRPPLFSRGTRALLCTGLLAFALAVRFWVLPRAPAARLPERDEAQTETDLTEPKGTEAAEAFHPYRLPQTPAFSPAEAEAIAIQGSCSYAVDKEALLLAPLPFAASGGLQVLIVHTHTTEAYAPQDSYVPTGAYHTLDETQNLLAVGDALARELERRGVGVLHDRTVHDHPDYNASYANARQTIEAQLAAHPSVLLVLDLHRDALDPPAREVTALDGADCARLMFVVGTDEGGLYHPFWQENLSVALKLQALLNRSAAGLCRDLNLRRERFNGQTSPGALLIEVGSTGNTLEEAENAMPYLAEAIAELLGITS